MAARLSMIEVFSLLEVDRLGLSEGEESDFEEERICGYLHVPEGSSNRFAPG